MKYLYKYLQSAYPYDDLIATNRRRGKHDLEYELLDTGVFDQDRYFDVFVEYAKAAPEDILVQITVSNRGPEPATLHVLPTVWFRNTWSWAGQAPRPMLRQVAPGAAGDVIAATHPDLGERFFYSEGAAELLFIENETNSQRLVGVPNRTPYVKDGINDAARRCRPAATWSRPTAPPGWPSTARTWSKSPVSWRCTGRAIWRWGSSSSSTTCGSLRR
jgi:hypothetical protein